MTSVDGLEILQLRGAQAAILDGAGVPMHGAPATGLAMLTNGHLGCDLIRVKPGEQFPVHVHPGDHLLLCLAGEGTITVADVTYKIVPGDLCMVEGVTPHAVGGGDNGDHLILAIGAPHTPVDSPKRMSLVDWAGQALSEPLFPTGN
jgi:quercetin dioxygenase-like cupin family protein